MLVSVLERLGGVTIGEGGAVLVAGAGTRKPYASLAGFGIARDTTASISNWGCDESAVVRAMRAALDDAEVDSVDAIYGSANGNARADALEARAIASLFRDRVPCIATKHIFGEYAAGGMLQLVAAILDVERSPRRVLVNSLSAGGGIVCAVVAP